ncbi:hypothetical protein BDV18DRAFT_135716 [Aspergillus unguis]
MMIPSHSPWRLSSALQVKVGRASLSLGLCGVCIAVTVIVLILSLIAGLCNALCPRLHIYRDKL